eukprot:COSAG05_NODE_908_length_6643_cov_2.923441_2_plen_91_part_00
MTYGHLAGCCAPSAAWSKDGFSWSNISGANGLAPYRLDGPFNLSRPYKAPNGSIVNASYYTPRPKVRAHDDNNSLDATTCLPCPVTSHAR